jgi:ribonuclease VapC
MVIDTSALLAILFDEPERQSFNDKIAQDEVRLMSAASYLESAIIVDYRLGYEGARDLRLFLAESAIELVPVSLEQADIAREAYRAYGRGNHPAKLNFGDCFAYALAKFSEEPLFV